MSVSAQNKRLQLMARFACYSSNLSLRSVNAVRYPQLKAGVGLLCSTSREAAACNSQGHEPVVDETIKHRSPKVRHKASDAGFAGSGFLGHVIPGLRSLRLLTRGLLSVAAPRLVDQTSTLTL